MKKLRITPLNIIAAFAFALLIIAFFRPKQPGHFDMSGFYKLILSSILIVSFITDMIFRFIFKELKRIWFVELFFIALTVIIFLILQK